MRPATEGPFMVIDSSLVAQIRDKLNRLEIYRLEVCPSTGVPLLRTVCLLGLPSVTPITPVSCLFSAMEWVPTSRHYKQSRSSRGYHIPFYSSKVGTMGLLFHYRVASGYSCQYTMIISVAGLLSAIHTRVHYIHWEEWTFYHAFVPRRPIRNSWPFLDCRLISTEGTRLWAHI